MSHYLSLVSLFYLTYTHLHTIYLRFLSHIIIETEFNSGPTVIFTLPCLPLGPSGYQYFLLYPRQTLNI